MAGFKAEIFKGIVPRFPESLLPEGTATIAQNCDFAYGELRNTKGGFLFGSMQNTPASIYTDDGAVFYTWPTDTDAVRSPLVSDTFNRLYFSTTGGLFVTNRLGQQLTGGVPASSYQVGVQRPTAAPTLVVSGIKPVNATTATLVWTFHYEYGGVKYQEATITPTSLGNEQYSFIPTAKAVDTPEGAFPVVRLVANWLVDNSQIFDIYTNNSSFTSTAGYYSLSMADDAGQATYTIKLTGTIPEKDKEARVYVYTYVNTYNEEGPPSPVAAVNTGAGVTVTVTTNKIADGSYAPIKEIRVYRTPTGSDNATYYYAGSISVQGQPAGNYNFTDDVRPELLNEELSSTEAYAPNTALRGLMALPNGILCAYKGNELHFSEAYKPWSWPPSYVKVLPNSIVGGISYGAGAVVTTTTSPYLVSGVTADSMTAQRLNVDQAGVSKWSIAVANGSVVYASNDGLVELVGGRASLEASSKFFTREVWRTRFGAGLSSMRLAVWDGRLVIFSSNNAFTPAMIRLDEAEGAMTDLPSFVAQTSFVSPMSDQMYYATGAVLYQFNGGTDQSAVWQSREIVLDRPVNFGIAQAVTQGSWTMELWAFVNGAYSLRHTQSIAQGVSNFRLPSGYESDRYRIKISGSGRFRELRVAQTARELATL